MWEEVFKQLEIVAFQGYRPLPKPSELILDQFERQIGFKLPDSYRSYARVFGAGELGGYARIRLPGLLGEEASDLEECNRFTHEGDQHLIAQYGSAALIPRLLYFGTSFTGDIFGWNTQEVTQTTPVEYSIYGLPRSGHEVVRLAESFREFIEGVLSGSVSALMGYDFDKSPEEWLEFIPYVELPPQGPDRRQIACSS